LKKKTKSLKLDNLNLFKDFEDFFNQQSMASEELYFDFPNFIKNSDHIKDHQTVHFLKKQCHEEFNPLLDLFAKIPIFHLAYRYSLFAKELFMLGSFIAKKGQVYTFSTGLKNVFCIALGQSLKRMTDPGIVFCFAGYFKNNVENKNYYSKIYGDIEYFETEEHIFFVSNWRRLKRTKLFYGRCILFNLEQ